MMKLGLDEINRGHYWEREQDNKQSSNNDKSLFTPPGGQLDIALPIICMSENMES